MIKKIICLGVILVMMIAMLACEPKKKGDFYTLQEAYDQGLITHDDLKSIAYYQNGGSEDESFVPMSKNPEVLSNETEKAIKETIVYDVRKEDPVSGGEIKIINITIQNYYGTYNNCVAVMISGARPYNAEICEIEIDGVLFHYNNGNRIIIFKKK